MPENTRRSHFVPQGYLRFFTDSRIPDYIYSYNKKTLRSFGNSIKNLAYEDWFYRVELEDGTLDNSMEDYFHKYENDLQYCIREAIEQLDKRCALNQTLIYRLSRQIPHLMFRTNQMRKLMQFLLENNAKRVRSKYPDADLSRVKTYDSKLYQIDFIRNESEIERWISAWSSCFWIPIRGLNVSNVYTSDNPIIIAPSAFDGETGNSMNDIYFPISSKWLMWVIDPLFYLEKDYRFNGRPELSDPIIKRNTTAQCIQSLQLVFSSKQEMSDVHDLVSKHPDMQSPMDFIEDCL